MAAPTTPTGAARAVTRTTVRLTVRGTSEAVSTATHPPHNRIDATASMARERSDRAAARSGPAVNGRITHAVRNVHGPGSADGRLGVPTAGEICPPDAAVAIPVAADDRGNDVTAEGVQQGAGA